MSDEQDWVAVARVLKPHALGGNLKLLPLTSTAEDLVESPIERVHVRRAGRIERVLTIEGMSVRAEGLIASFAEITDRTAAEQLAGAELVIPESELWEQPEGRYYTFQL